MKIAAPIFRNFLKQVLPIDEGTITVTPEKMVMFVQTAAQDRQVKVEYPFAAPEVPFEMNLSNFRTLLLTLSRFSSEELDVTTETNENKVPCRLIVRSGRKSLKIPMVSKTYIRQGQDLTGKPEATFVLDAKAAEDFLGDMTKFGDRPLVTLQHTEGNSALNIKIESDKLAGSLENVYEIGVAVPSFNLKFRSLDALYLAEGPITIWFGTKAIIAAYKTSDGIDVQHTLAVYIGD